MPDYSLFILGENELSISGGGQLDGVTQGDGSHLDGLTITLNSNAWTEVLITDGNSDFSDNDGSQVLNGAQTINGTNYASGTGLEAEYGLTLSDGTNTYQVVGFNVRNSAPSYATVEGLAFIGGPGGFPPIGVPLTVVSSQEGPSFAAASYATPICFNRGTLVETRKGLRPVESLRVGDPIATMDDGYEPLRWIKSQHVIGMGRFAPVQIPGHLTGTGRTLRVSQQHCLLVSGPHAELLFGVRQVFVRAAHLIGQDGIALCQSTRPEYFHLLLRRHAVIFAEGMASESLHPGQVALIGPDRALTDALLVDRPRAAEDYGPAARKILRRHEAKLLTRQAPLIDLLRGLRHTA